MHHNTDNLVGGLLVVVVMRVEMVPLLPIVGVNIYAVWYAYIIYKLLLALGS